MAGSDMAAEYVDTIVSTQARAPQVPSSREGEKWGMYPLIPTAVVRSGTDQTLSRNVEVTVQVADHFDGEFAFTAQYFIHAIGLADGRHQVFHRQSTLFHAKPDRFDGVRRLDRQVPGFIGLHQRDE